MKNISLFTVNLTMDLGRYRKKYFYLSSSRILKEKKNNNLTINKVFSVVLWNAMYNQLCPMVLKYLYLKSIIIYLYIRPIRIFLIRFKYFFHLLSFLSRYDLNIYVFLFF